ncbi:MAG: hypothetical protein ABI947_24790 [Chloroflexota bacterium]
MAEQNSLPVQQWLTDSEPLTPSLYDTAAVALYPGPAREACIKWLIEHRNKDGSWGDAVSWQDRYACTYATALALLEAGYSTLAEDALNQLPVIAGTDNMMETLAFGGLIGSLDRYSANRFGAQTQHSAPVAYCITDEARKWKALKQWHAFWDPRLSTAGFIGECVYDDPSIDLRKFMNIFGATANGSITNSPGASAFTLLACRQRGEEEPATLRSYVESLNPYHKPISVLDQIPHFVTAWVLMYLPENSALPDSPPVDALRQTIFHSTTLGLVQAAGDTTIPGDIDTTAAGILGLRIPREQRQDLLNRIDFMFDTPRYLTFAYERNPSSTTNIHVAAAWPDNPHLDIVLDWLEAELERSFGMIHCKWHISPYYATAELVRLFAPMCKPAALRMVARASAFLLESQRNDGGWGWHAQSTAEETAYSLMALYSLRDHQTPHYVASKESIDSAIQRAATCLSRLPDNEFPRLWIGKSLYCVKPIVRALKALALHRVSLVSDSVREI